MDIEILSQVANQAMRECRFDDAINIYREVVEATESTEEQRSRALTAIDVIQEINGFVNTDLMNP